MFEKSAVMPLIGDSSSKLNKDVKRIATKALDNTIEPFPGYPDIQFGPSFDWEHLEPQLETTYQLYLQNLRVVGTLLAVYEHRDDRALLDKASEIVTSWLDYVEAGGETEMTWYDHAVGARVRVLMQYLYLMQSEELPVESARIERILKKHADVLLDDSHHRMNNHGIMMDMALMSLGIGLDEPAYLYHALGRVESIFWQTFSETGMHQENSPEYHGMVYRMYREIESYLNDNGFSLGQDILRKLDVAAGHFSRIVMPNGELPGIGDSSARTVSAKPNWESFHDSMSGFTALKSESSQSYISFVCGYSATAHKHSDDLSVVLNYRGKNFFVDAGKYNYGKNKYRRYVVSYRAHNSFTPNTRYNRPPDNRYTKVIATDKYLEANNYSLASGYNHGFPGAKLRRTVISVPKFNIILLNDVGHSTDNTGQAWTERFMLPPTANAIIRDDGSVQIENQGEVIYLSMTDPKDTEIEVIKGDRSEDPVEAIISPASNKAIETSQLVFRGKESLDTNRFFVISLGTPFTGSIFQSGDSIIVSPSEFLTDHSIVIPRFSSAER